MYLYFTYENIIYYSSLYNSIKHSYFSNNSVSIIFIALFLLANTPLAFLFVIPPFLPSYSFTFSFLSPSKPPRICEWRAIALVLALSSASMWGFGISCYMSSHRRGTCYAGLMLTYTYNYLRWPCQPYPLWRQKPIQGNTATISP